MAEFGGTGPIQRLPVGFLDALNLKNNGQLPQWLPNSIQPTLEMRDWLLAQDKEVLYGQRGFNGPSGGGGSLALTSVANAPLASPIPQGEIWYCWSSRIQVTLTNAAVAGDAIYGGFGAIALSPTDTSALSLGSRNEQQIVVPAVFAGIQWQLEAGGTVNRFLRPRSSIFFSAGAWTIAAGNSVSITVALEVSRLRV